MPDLGKAYVQIVPSAQGIKGQIESALSKDVKSAGEASGKSLGSAMMSAAKKVIAAAGIGKVIGSAFNASAELEQNVGGIKKIYGDAAQMVATNAQKAFKTVQMSSNDYLGMATSFGAALIKSTSGDYELSAAQAQKAISQISDNYNTFGGDLENLKRAYMNFAKGNFTMLDNLNLGYGGSKQGMQDLLTEAEKISGIKFDIGNFSDIVDAIDIVQEHLNILGTSANEAATTLEGSKNMMKSAWQDVLSTIGMTTKGEVTNMGFQWKTALGNMVEAMGTFGKNAIPALSSIAQALPTVLVQAITTGVPLMVKGGAQILNGLINGITQALPLLATEGPKMIAELGKAILNAVPQLISSGTRMLETITQGITTGLPNFISKAMPLILQFSQALLANMPMLITAGIELILALTQGLIQSLPMLIDMAPQIITNFANVINQNIPQLIKGGIDLIVMIIKGIIQTIPELVSNIPKIFQAVLSAWMALNWVSLGTKLISFIGNGVKSLASQIPNALKTIGTNAKNFFTSIPWKSGGTAIINFIKSGIQSLFNAIPSALKSIGSNAMNAFKGLSWAGIGRAIVQGIKNGVANAGGILFSALKSLASRALSSAKSALKIGSPSRVFAREIGRWIPEGVAIGVDANIDPVERAMAQMSDVATGDFQSNLTATTGIQSAPLANTTSQAVSMGNVNINVYAREGQSVEAIADAVQARLVALTMREQAVYG